MASNQPFNGLTMPVFAAFGWAGEEQAIAFALSQLESFINALKNRLTRDLRAQFPYAGIDRANKVIYLASTETVDEDIHVIFYARPLSFTITLTLSNKKLLAKAMKRAERNPAEFRRLLHNLEPGWSLRLQQMQIMDDAGTEMAHYQDLFKDDVANLDAETAQEVLSRAAYLNTEPQWVTPFYLSFKLDSEQASAMRLGLITAVIDHLTKLLPIIDFLSGKLLQTSKARAPSQRQAKPAAAQETSASELSNAAVLEQFVFVTELTPLSIRKGFINLTAEHWPFFAINARTETRNVTLLYGKEEDSDSSVWRLVPHDQARLVLSQDSRHWLEANFNADDRVQITATKDDNNEITITLEAVA